MNLTKHFKSYAEAKAFYEMQTGDCSLGSSKEHGWVVQYEGPQKSKLEEVHEALLAGVENNSMVCLDNINLKALGITERQFSGYCSQLAQLGLYYTQSDWNGWAQVK